jgi:hypothetical protein
LKIKELLKVGKHNALSGNRKEYSLYKEYVEHIIKQAVNEVDAERGEEEEEEDEEGESFKAKAVNEVDAERGEEEEEEESFKAKAVNGVDAERNSVGLFKAKTVNGSSEVKAVNEVTRAADKIFSAVLRPHELHKRRRRPGAKGSAAHAYAVLRACGPHHQTLHGSKEKQ